MIRGRLTVVVACASLFVLMGLGLALPALAQAPATVLTTTSQSNSSTTAASAVVSLSASSEGAGVTISITGSGFVANRTVTAIFGTTPLSLSGTCTTNPAGGLSGCSFSVPNVPHGSYTVTVSDGVSTPTAGFTIPVISIPESTLLVTMTSVGLSLVTQLVTRRVVNLEAERRMKAEVSAFNKEKRAATLAKDKAKLEKLKKRELPMRQEQAKVSSARLKVTAITFVPLLGVYYLMASFLGGFNVVVAHSPIPIPYLVGTNGIMALFWWYMLSSFTFSSLLTKLLHTTT
jgi:uncharacterized membrane protein (DUF106 family)